MEQVYTETRGSATADREQRAGPRSFLRRIEAVKEGARIETVARDYGEFRLAGSGRLLGRCVSPDHEDKTPSLTVFTEEQRFKCFGIGCGAHGDVIDLVRLAEGGPERCELWEAMMILSRRYGISLPERPPSWYAKQERQKGLREKIEDERIEHLRDLVFRLIWMPWLVKLPAETREAVAPDAWAKALPLARQVYERRRGA